jgi:hypothetical protein
MVVAGEDLPVGPLGGQGAVESFDLAVLPGAVRLDELVRGTQGRHRSFDVGALSVAEVVVGDDPFDTGNAVAGEVFGGSQDESGAGGAFLVREDLAVRQAAVVIDHGVHVVVADPGSLLGSGRAHRAAVSLPAAANGDASDLLHIDVHQLPGPVAFIADRGALTGPDHFAGQRVQQSQVRNVVAS